MKKLLSLVVLCLVGMTTFAGAEDSEIKFLEQNLKAGKAKAAKQDKIIFVDVYATWCGPCKMMEKYVFNDEDVATLFNKNFINMRIDGETTEGREIMRKYSINSYPTYLFLDAEGELLFKDGGYQSADNFLALAKKMLDENNHAPKMKERFENGERESAFVIDYLRFLASADREDEIKKVMEKWVSEMGNSEMFADDIYPIVFAVNTEISSGPVQTLAANREDFVKLNGEEDFQALVRKIVVNHGKSREDLEDVATFEFNNFINNTIGRDQLAKNQALSKVHFFVENELHLELFEFAKNELLPGCFEDWKLYDVATWSLLRSDLDKGKMKELLPLIKHAIKVNRCAETVLTLSLYKIKVEGSGKAKDSIVEARRLAEVQGVNYGENFDETLEWLEGM